MATVVVVVPAVLYPLVGVWTLLWLVLVAAASGFLALGGPGSQGRPGTAGRDGRQDGRAPHPEGGPHAYPGGARSGAAHAYADGPVHGTRVGEIALATAVPDYDLRLSAVVHWRWSGHVDLTVRNPVAPAVRDIVSRAAAKVARTRPRDHGRTECDLGAQLAVEHAVTGTGIVVWAEHVRLHLPEEDAERLARLSDLRKDLGLRAALQETERAHTPAYGRAHTGGEGHPARGHGGAVPEPAQGHGVGASSAAGSGRAAHGRRPWGGSWSRFGASPEPDQGSGPGPDEPGEAPGPFEDAGPSAGQGPDESGPPGRPSPYGSHPDGPAARGPNVHGPGAHGWVPRTGDDGEENDFVYLDPVHGMPEEPVFTGPGHDVDEYGYESYWWPAESIPDSAEEDVQVAVLRGMIEAVPDRHARAEFAEQQLGALEKAGYGEVARRVREGF